MFWPAMMYPAEQQRIGCNKRSRLPGKSWLPCRRLMVRTRNAILPDVEQIHTIIRAYSGNGTLLPRTLAELRENVRDFVVAEDDGKIVGCGALHLYGMHLAEIRSIAVKPATKGRGIGRLLVNALMAESRRQAVSW